MSENITLHAPLHDKLGAIHVGVTREGFISVAGEVHDIADGQTVTIDRVPVAVKREGGEYVFTNTPQG
jgi:hypothetical protein